MVNTKLPVQGVQVRSLIGELRSYVPLGQEVPAILSPTPVQRTFGNMDGFLCNREVTFMPSAVSSQLGSFWSQGLGVPILQGLLTQIFYFKVNNTVIEKNISSFNKGASL